MANIGGWLEDAPRAFKALELQGLWPSMPSVTLEAQLVPYQLVGMISP